MTPDWTVYSCLFSGGWGRGWSGMRDEGWRGRGGENEAEGSGGRRAVIRTRTNSPCPANTARPSPSATITWDAGWIRLTPQAGPAYVINGCLPCASL